MNGAPSVLVTVVGRCGRGRRVASFATVLAVLAGLVILGSPPTSRVPAESAASAERAAESVSEDVVPVARRTRKPLGARVKVGAYVDGMTAAPARLDRFEKRVRRRADIASYYWGFGDHFPGPVERRFAAGGTRDVLLSWDMGPTRFTEWTGGRHDDYLDVIVGLAKDYPHRLFVRPWPEMNGDWQDFQPTADGSRRYGGTYAEFRAAWRYLVNYFRDRGVRHVKWVFNPTVDTYAGTTPVKKIWPGKAYVDVLGIDGFNWGQDSSWGEWKSFESIFRPMYRRLTSLHPTAPVWICEIGSKEPRVADGAPVSTSHDKARWIRRTLASRAFPRIRALVWFQARKERDWRVNSTRRSLRVFRRHISR